MDSLICDVWPGDYNGDPNIEALKNAGGPWRGIILKVAQGVDYPGATAKGAGEWFRHNWQTAGPSIPGRWKRGLYLYGNMRERAYLQIHYANSLLHQAGGPSLSDLPIMLDVEEAGNPGTIDRAALIAWVREAAEECVALGLGSPILYGNIYLAEHGYTGLNGCRGIVVASYTPALEPKVLTRLGLSWPKDLVGWQYTGTDKRHGVPTPQLPIEERGLTVLGPAEMNYPTESPLGPGPCDITAWQKPEML